MLYRFSPAMHSMPQLVGKQSTEALRLLSDHALIAHIITEIDDAQIPAGTILQQNPAPASQIREHQVVHLVMSRKPPTQKTPFCVGKTVEEILTLSGELGIHVQPFYIPHHAPVNTCFTQYPASSTPLEESLIVYLASSDEKPFLWPSFIGKPLHIILDFLNNYNLQSHIISAHPGPISDTALVLDQRPLPGSYIPPSALSSLYIQLYV